MFKISYNHKITTGQRKASMWNYSTLKFFLFRNDFDLMTKGLMNIIHFKEKLFLG